MTAVMEAPARAETTDEPEEFCHLGSRASMSRTLCGRVIREPECCAHGAPPCGREKCPECHAIAEGRA